MRERKKKIKLSVCILQLRLKEIAGRALLHTDADTQNAALVIPVKVPPRIYRLDPRRDRGGYSLGGSRGRVRNYYSIKEGLDWLRTTDFTPQAAFGRSFAYRCCNSAESADEPFRSFMAAVILWSEPQCGMASYLWGLNVVISIVAEALSQPAEEALVHGRPQAGYCLGQELTIRTAVNWSSETPNCSRSVSQHWSLKVEMGLYVYATFAKAFHGIGEPHAGCSSAHATMAAI